MIVWEVLKSRRVADGNLPAALNAPSKLPCPTRTACGSTESLGEQFMSKPGHKIKKANHGKRPASSKTRKAKRRRVRT
jgi:hypothetical protein